MIQIITLATPAILLMLCVLSLQLSSNGNAIVNGIAALAAVVIGAGAVLLLLLGVAA